MGYPRTCAGWKYDVTKPLIIDDKVLAAVDREWRTALEIFAILDEGAFASVSGPPIALLSYLTAACGSPEGSVSRTYASDSEWP